MTPVVASLLCAVGLLLVPVAPARTRLGEVVAHRVPAGADESVSPRRASSSQVTRHARVLLTVGSCVLVVGALGVVLGWPVALLVTVLCGALWYRSRRGPAQETTEPLELAAGWDLLAAGLRAGLPVAVTVRAVAAEFPAEAATALLEVADSLALGADPVSAWEPALRHTDTAGLAQAARRTARTGSGLAGIAEDIAAQARARAGEQAQARAQRAAVWVSAPLGLCFLPAFLCLGVLPVVVGMVHEIAGQW